MSVDLSAFAGRSIVPTVATTGGPAGTLDFDSAGFGEADDRDPLRPRWPWG